jgi:transposase
MKAYSLDLRQKIIDIYENESISQRHLPQRFPVSLSFIVKLKLTPPKYRNFSPFNRE